jgi:hypothetical protein
MSRARAVHEVLMVPPAAKKNYPDFILPRFHGLGIQGE